MLIFLLDIFLLVINNGFIIQFGSSKAGSQSVTITMPLTFTSFYSCTKSGNGSNYWQNYPTTSQTNLSQFVIHWRDAGGSGWWICIGY